MEHKRRRGRAQKSCLTCKHRHKKCDLTHPKCNRCVEGGHECRYEDNARGNDCSQPNGSSSLERTQSDSLVPLATVRHSPLHAAQITNTRIPPSIPLDSWRLITYIVAQFDQAIENSYFKPKGPHLSRHRESVVQHLQSSSVSRRAKLMLYKVCESTMKGEGWRHHATFDNWARLLEEELCSMWKRSLATEPHSQLEDALEVSYVKIRLLRGQNAYQHLRHTAPTFLHTIISDPSLYPVDQGISSIPLARVLSSSRCERWHFVFMDALYAMAYGLPQLIQYDTSPDPILGPDNWSTFVWSHGCPVESFVALVNINVCRDIGNNWEEIERALLQWQPRPACIDGWESWMSVAWLAIQESWRHALLAYLYMAICGVSSDDPRVQSSIRQILRILETVLPKDMKLEKPAKGVQLFVQYFIIGVCARTEKQRTIARHVLVDPIKTSLWQVSGAAFVPVLDHLWHGAAAGGRPIKWSDYIHSREMVLPVLDA